MPVLGHQGKGCMKINSTVPLCGGESQVSRLLFQHPVSQREFLPLPAGPVSRGLAPVVFPFPPRTSLIPVKAEKRGLILNLEADWKK